MEKLQLLNLPEERERRLREIPEVYSDPNLDSMFESDEEDAKSDERKQGKNHMLMGVVFTIVLTHLDNILVMVIIIMFVQMTMYSLKILELIYKRRSLVLLENKAAN